MKIAASQSDRNQSALSLTPTNPEAVNCESLVDAEAAANLLRIHPKTVKRMAAAGKIPGMRIGKLWRFRPSALDDWMTSQIHCSRHPCPEPKGEQ
jgi:excisionase family DNA binding protein